MKTFSPRAIMKGLFAFTNNATKWSTIAMGLALTMFIIQACSNPSAADLSSDEDMLAKGRPANVGPAPFAPDFGAGDVQSATCDGPATYSLTAGQTIPVGNVTVDVVDGVIHVAFTSDAPWVITETHLQIVTTVPNGRGAPGQYTHNGNATSLTTYEVSLASLGLSTGSTFYVLAHAVVTADGGETSETAYGGKIQKASPWYGIMGFDSTPAFCEVSCTTDNFPEWPQDISHVTLVFQQSAGDTNGDGYYTVKFDGFDNLQNGIRDFDDVVDTFVAWLVDNNAHVTSSSNLYGVVIKGGRTRPIGYFNHGCNNSTGTNEDSLPAGINFEISTGVERAVTGNGSGIDTVYGTVYPLLN